MIFGVIEAPKASVSGSSHTQRSGTTRSRLGKGSNLKVVAHIVSCWLHFVIWTRRLASAAGSGPSKIPGPFQVARQPTARTAVLHHRQSKEPTGNIHYSCSFICSSSCASHTIKLAANHSSSPLVSIAPHVSILDSLAARAATQQPSLHTCTLSPPLFVLTNTTTTTATTTRT